MGSFWCPFNSSVYVNFYNGVKLQANARCTDTYYQAFSRDRKLLKALVYTIYILQTVQILFLTNTAFQYLAAGFGDPNTIDQVGTVWFSVCVIEGTGVYPLSQADD